jgi:Flp pilus assembly pilin Flp
MYQLGPLARRLRRLLAEEDGPTATEYAILLAMLVLVAVASIRGIGERMYNIYLAIDSTMPDGAGS